MIKNLRKGKIVTYFYFTSAVGVIPFSCLIVKKTQGYMQMLHNPEITNQIF